MKSKLCMMCVVILSLVSFKSNSAQQKELSTEDRAYKVCLEAKEASEAEACEVASQSFMGQRQNDKAYIAIQKACSLNDESCSQLYHIAFTVSPSEGKRASELLEKRCGENKMASCEALARAYQEQGQMSKALAVAKKYFIKEKRGIYPWYEYEYGDKKMAFEAMAEVCAGNNNECDFYLIHTVGNPYLDKLIAGTESNCKGLTNPAIGSSSCVLLGLYFYRAQNYQKAEEMWSLDCKRKNFVACIYNLGSDKIKSAKRLEAYQDYCGGNGYLPYIGFDQSSFDCKNFKNIKEISAISASTLKAAEDQLKSLIRTFEIKK